MLRGIAKTLALTLAFAAATAFAGEASWSDNFAKSLKEAKEAKKPMVALFTGSDWCPACIYVEGEILSKKEFQEAVKDSFVLFKAEFLENSKLKPPVVAQNEALREKYEIEAFPTFLLLDPEAKPLNKVFFRGESPKEFAEKLKAALKGDPEKK